MHFWDYGVIACSLWVLYLFRDFSGGSGFGGGLCPRDGLIDGRRMRELAKTFNWLDKH